jgi:tetratricopeptide (TPR) repeat protein
MWPSGRYEVHELLRQYGVEKLLQADEAGAVQQAHSAYYMTFMAERDEDIKGRRQEAGLREIRTDFENIRQAWLWAVEHRQVEAISPALDCLVNYAEMDFGTLDAQAILQRTVTALHPSAGETPHPVWERSVVRRERIHFVNNEQIDHEAVQRILARARERGDEFETAYCLWVLGDHANVINDYESHRACYEECLSLRQSAGDPYYIAHTFVGIAHVYIWQNEIENALQCLRQSAQIRRANGDRRNLCLSLTLLSSDLAMFGGFREAEALLDEALTIQVEIGKAPVYVGALAFKAMLAFWRGEFDTAVQLLQAGQDFARQLDYVGFRQVNLALLSWTASVGGDYQRGYALCQEVRSIGGFSESHLMLWLTSWGLGLAHCGL